MEKRNRHTEASLWKLNRKCYHEFFAPGEATIINSKGLLTFLTTLYNVCSVLWGGGGGGEDIMMHDHHILSIVGDVQYRGEI